MYVLVILLQLLWDFCSLLCIEHFDSVIVIQQEMETVKYVSLIHA